MNVGGRLSDHWKAVNAEWQGESAFLARNQKGTTLQVGSTDERPAFGPMELVLAGLAGCTGMDIASILQKKKEAITGLKVFVRGRMPDEYPKTYQEIHVTYVIWGNNIDPAAVEQAIQLSEEKYCSVGLMLNKAAPIISQYQILAPSEEFIEQDKEMIHD